MFFYYSINHKAACRCNGVGAVMLLGMSCLCHAFVMAVGWILINQLYEVESSLISAAAFMSSISAGLVPTYIFHTCAPWCHSKCCVKCRAKCCLEQRINTLFKFGLIFNVFCPLLGIIGGILFLAIGVTLDNFGSNVLPLGVSVGVFGIFAGSMFISSQISCWVCCIHKNKLKDEEKGPRH